MSLTQREQTILAMHKAGLSDREMLEVLAMRGDEAALNFKAEEKAESELYSELMRFCDVENIANGVG